MGIPIKFDPNQGFQRDAINAVLELFAGQEAVEQGFADDSFATEEMLEGFSELVFGNTLSLAPEAMRRNLRRVQDTPTTDSDGEEWPAIPEGMRTNCEPGEAPEDFSVEMETGTGKTYVYLRSLAELHQKYGFRKFVIVVPSVAIREGVLSSLRLLKEHISELYNGLQYDSYVYDSSHLNYVRQFATSSHLQIMVINIDAFAKDSTIMNKPAEVLGFYKPIEYVRRCRPIVIMDEPQNMDTEIRREAIASLWPLFKLRYSATHRDLKHLVYRLTPVDAYDLNLVKRISVLAVTKDEDFNDPYVEVVKIHATSSSVTATVLMDVAGKLGTQRVQKRIRKDDDLYAISGNRSVYEGWTVEDICAGDTRSVQFGNGRKVPETRSSAQDEDDQWIRLQVRMAIEAHFDMELRLKRALRRKIIPAAIKPLTLFFIDRVANYHPTNSKLRVWFEEEYEAVRSDAKYAVLNMPDVDVVHDGYFATSAKGEAKDSTVTKEGKPRDTKETAAAFERIMRKKEELLGFEEPLRFIFSHSALAEGWDNPNVFTICNLQDGKSTMRKRQQIGRGLRLPVMVNGERCHVEHINVLTVIANESFTSFAAQLQKEIETETGVSFKNRVSNGRKPRRVNLNKTMLASPEFKALWAAIADKTRYSLNFDTSQVIQEAVKRVNTMDAIEPVKFRVARHLMEIGAYGVGGEESLDKGDVIVEGARKIPDVVAELCRRVPLSRATIVSILKQCNRLEDVKLNPSVFIDRVSDAMNHALYEQVADGIVYSPKSGERWDAKLIEKRHNDETIKPVVVPVTKSIVDNIACDSAVEQRMAEFLEARADVPLFVKLPDWFKIPTPLGNYNPDWAFVRNREDGQAVYLVRETKGTDDLEKLQWESEGWKIKFGKAHFNALRVDFAFGHNTKVLIEVSPEDRARGAR
ncbi:restriction endonuclease [Dietzia cinnamea]|uniref:restriction endonuclease n=1 Tax=Dietzia cinnamea TaxID=321318 RepID=UPI0021A90A92|nr:DEAD/DEAH box helicase family protein [Dietzia cinnamea]MCT2121741.1 DEAD/DEAH box helicase family protein [Dietzia cinnamea]MCT2145783.1 DEAD/DEAH box helicase family protein [Dietzia cinnamea]MCT2305395.1 DEAD/DEAH box helicase family protein [Dietzia cinnamea]